MKKFLKLVFLTWLAGLVFLAHGQPHTSPQAVEPVEFESIWLWRVDTPSRIIYIAGEQHNYALVSNERLSHKLAYSAYESSSRVLLEGFNLNGIDSHRQLKDRLAATTWVALSNAVHVKLRSIENVTDEQRATSHAELIALISRWSDFSLLSGLPGLLIPWPDQTEPYKTEEGFLGKITKEKGKANFRKIGYLEPRNNVDSVWLEQCGQPQDTEELIKKILVEIEKGPQYHLLRQQSFLKIFKNPAATNDAIAEFSQNDPMQDEWDRCTVLPRNLQWIQKIKQEFVLDKSTQPLMIAVGLGHVVGKTGLLELLCKEGYCQSQRVLQLN